MKYVIAIVAFVVLISGAGYFFTTNNFNGMMVAEEGHHGGEEMKEYEMYPQDVVARVKANKEVVLLDVRTPQEYEEVHLKNALLLPVQELSQKSLTAIGLGEDMKDKEIIIYCRSGARSETAYNIMKSLGYTNIKSVAGGMIHWEEDNYPLTEVGPYTGVSAETSSIMTSVAKDGPRISFNATSYDFGMIPQFGGTVQKSFTITNSGTETLTIGDITTSCSCTSATISSTSVEPGKTAELMVVFDPNFHEEPFDVFKRTVFIPTNDPTQPEAEIVIQVDIDEGK